MSNSAQKEGSFREPARDDSNTPPNTMATSQENSSEDFAPENFVGFFDGPPKNFPPEMFDAIRAGRVWMPQDIRIFRRMRGGLVIGVQEMAQELQFYVNNLDLSDDATLADDLLGLIRAMVARLNWLADKSKLGDSPRFHETWPINYAPHAGKGASKWEAANALYQQLGCGKDANIRPGKKSQQDPWHELAMDGVKAALLARRKAPSVHEKVKGAKLSGTYEFPLGHKKLRSEFYLCQDGKLIVWPQWAEESRGLPDKLTWENRREFLPVVRELVRIYIAGDKQTTLEYLNMVTGQYPVSEWNSDVFNNQVMPRVKDALDTLARQRSKTGV